MITHRMSTQPFPEPPVRAYKMIAVVFLCLTVALLAVVVFVTSKKAEITIIAKEDTESVMATVLLAKTAQGQTIAGTVSSTIFVRSETFHPTGNKQVEDVARGEVVLYNTTNLDQPLVKTTRLLSPDGILFRLSEGVVVPATGKVTAAVYADQPGKKSEIGPTKFSIPGLAEAKQKVIYGESTKPMVGGVKTVGSLSASDISQAEESYKEKVREAFVATLPPLAAGEQRAVSVVDTSVLPLARPGDEVSSFVITGTSTIAVVSYRADDLTRIVTTVVEGKIDRAAERFLTATREPQVTVSLFDAKAGTAELSVRQETVVTLDANVEKLAPRNFFGKKKAEIEQYVRALEHVSAVDVKFSPGWVTTAPGVAEKIRIIVKNVR